MAEHLLRTAVWGDGAGSTLEATLKAIHEGKVNFEVDTVFTTDGKAGILDVVDAANKNMGMDIKPVVVTKSYVNKRQTDEAQDQFLGLCDRNNVRDITLMGCLVILGSGVVEHFNGIVPEKKLPRTLEEAKKIMVPGDTEFEFWLPTHFDEIVNTGPYGAMNTHPAPTSVTANTYGQGAQEQIIRLRSRNSEVTYHAVAPDIDTGPVGARHGFLVGELPPVDASDEVIKEYARLLFIEAQKTEKDNLPFDVERHLKQRAEYEQAA